MVKLNDILREIVALKESIVSSGFGKLFNSNRRKQRKLHNLRKKLHETDNTKSFERSSLWEHRLLSDQFAVAVGSNNDSG